jgi:hypothetical protein
MLAIGESDYLLVISCRPLRIMAVEAIAAV